MAADLIASTDELSQLLRRLAARDRVRSEATVQADVRQLLLTGGLGLDDHDLDVQLETQVGDRRRIDVKVGFTVIEVKKELGKQGIVQAAEEQLAGYVAARAAQTGERYVGVLTDGREWRASLFASGWISGEDLSTNYRHHRSGSSMGRQACMLSPRW